MQSQWSLRIAAVLMTIVAGGTQTALAWEPGRLTALAARQDLRGEVCVAMADGRISSAERHMILADAKSILKPEEYAGFKRALDRLSPPQPAVAKRTTKVTQRKKSPLTTQRKASPLAKSSPAPIIPTGAVLPDRVALVGGVR